jgi:hypothetical protein
MSSLGKATLAAMLIGFAVPALADDRNSNQERSSQERAVASPHNRDGNRNHSAHKAKAERHEADEADKNGTGASRSREKDSDYERGDRR